MRALQYGVVKPSVEHSDLGTIASHMFSLMIRNIATDGFVFTDPVVPGRLSKAGCVIASPSYPNDLEVGGQNYVFNWMRDAAIAAIELVAAHTPTAQPLTDYVVFADICQKRATTIGYACYTIDGNPRASWTEQSDGPALQTMAILRAYARLDRATQALAQTIIGKNLAYLLGSYKNPTYSLWEEHKGASFFARSVQLSCLREVKGNTLKLSLPAGIDDAIAWLETALDNHWNGQYYRSLLDPSPAGYDPNIDVVMAAVYGAIPCTDTKLLATAALLRDQWANSTSPSFYPINADDQLRGVGPMLGRYPDDAYDGDSHARTGDHPWALCTCNFAELYYRLAREIAGRQTIPLDNLSRSFFGQVGVGANTKPGDAVAALWAAGDKMLNAVLFHSDHLELSEQFDGTTGYEKSVRDLTWSYAAFLSAARARLRHGGQASS
jgi:glucoamylase